MFIFEHVPSVWKIVASGALFLQNRCQPWMTLTLFRGRSGKIKRSNKWTKQTEDGLSIHRSCDRKPAESQDLARAFLQRAKFDDCRSVTLKPRGLPRIFARMSSASDAESADERSIVRHHGNVGETHLDGAACRRLGRSCWVLRRSVSTEARVKRHLRRSRRHRRHRIHADRFERLYAVWDASCCRQQHRPRTAEHARRRVHWGNALVVQTLW